MASEGGQEEAIEEVDPFTLPALFYADKLRLPKTGAVYILLNRISGQVLYIGETQDLRVRWRKHHVTKRFERATLAGLEIAWIDEHDYWPRYHLERALIKRLQPSLNEPGRYGKAGVPIARPKPAVKKTKGKGSAR